MLETRTYHINNLIVNWGGILCTGFGDAAVEVSKMEDDWTEKAGSDGLVVRSRNLNGLGTAKVTLSPGSPTNPLFAQQAMLDAATGLYKPSFQLAYFGSSILVNAESAWVKKIPTLNFGKEVGDIEWVFTLNPMTQFTGGLSI